MFYVTSNSLPNLVESNKIEIITKAGSREMYRVLIVISSSSGSGGRSHDSKPKFVMVGSLSAPEKQEHHTTLSCSGFFYFSTNSELKKGHNYERYFNAYLPILYGLPFFFYI